MKYLLHSLVLGLGISSFLQAETMDSCIAEAKDSVSTDIAATVNSHAIGAQEFVATLQTEAKNRFYHALAPEAETASFRLEIINQLIETRLLSDFAYFEKSLPIATQKLQLLDIDLSENLADTDLTAIEKEPIKTFYLCQLERDDMVQQLRNLVDSQTTVSDSDVLDYYHTYPEKFTSPVRNRLGLILVGVDPFAPATAWVVAKNKADALYLQLQEGADFADIATEHSTDISARHGGDMGYQHLGMLGDAVETAADTLEPGDISQPINLLEGWAIVKLIEQQPATLNPFDKVKTRASELALRDAQEMAWLAQIAQLRANATIEMNIE